MATDTSGAALLRVLLIDDDAMERTALRLLLEERRCEVFAVGDDEDCLEAVRRVEPHVVIADLLMAQGEALGTISAIRERRPDACIVALAEANNAEVSRLALQLGADGAVDRPMTPESLQQAMREALGRRRNGQPGGAASAGPAPGTARRIPSFVYRPMWDVKRNLLSTYICVPVCAPGAQPHRLPTNGLGGLPLTEAQGAALADLDILALRKVVSDLDSQRQAGRRVLLGCAVHFSTLKDPALRARYLSVCRTIGPGCRNDLIFEIVLSADDAWHFRAVDTACALDTYCRAKLVRLSRHRTSLVALERQRIHAVGFDVSGADAPERHLVDELKSFAAAASRAGFHTYVRGLGSVSLASAAVCAGFDYADGDAIRRVTDVPDAIYRYDLRDLVRRTVSPSDRHVATAG